MSRFTKYSLFAVSSCAALLSLSACSIPNSLPRGYVYHQDAYKSPNPPESAKFSAKQRATMGPEQADQFRMAVYSLVENLTNRAGLPPKPVFVMKPEPMTAFYANMDNDLRESLRHMGYKLADAPEGGYAFAYNAEIIEKPKPAPGVEEPVIDTSPNVHLVLYVLDGTGEDAKVLTQEAGDFYIRGAEELSVPFVTYPGTYIPEMNKSGSAGGNYQQ